MLGKRNRLIAICYLVILLISSLVKIPKINAEVKFGGINSVTSEEGNIVYTVENKKSTNPTVYGTLGWIIRFDEANGKPTTKDNNYGIMWYSDEGVKKDPDIEIGDGMLRTKYTFPREAIVNALSHDEKLLQKFYDIENNKGGQIYLNAIFQVYNQDSKGNRTKKGGPIYSYYGIVNAEPWDNKSSFPNYYDVPVPYEPIQDVPTTIEYRTSQNILLKSTTKENTKIGSDKNVNFPETFRTEDGIEYKLYRSYYIILDKPSKKLGDLNMNKDKSLKLADIKSRSETVVSPGLKFVGMYKAIVDEPEPIEGEVKEKELTEPTPRAVIKADTRQNEAFNVEEGIPVTESVYVQASDCQEYIISYKFVKVTGMKKYPLKLKKKYTLKWTTYGEPDKDGKIPSTDHEDTEEVKNTVEVQKAYAYWVVQSIDVYTVDGTMILNDALPGEKIDLSIYGIKIPTINCNHSLNLENHLFEPKTYRKDTIEIDGDTVIGDGAKPNLPEEDFRLYVDESMLSEPIVKNDKLVFNEKTIMTDVETEKEGKSPVEIRDGDMISQDALYKSGVVIPITKANKKYTSSGTVTYKNLFHIGGKSYEKELGYDIEEINPVVVHTPVVCDGKVGDKKEFNQMIKPNDSMASIILDMNFTIQFPDIGTHRDIKGYGTRDYSKYTAKKQVMFPFDVYYGSQYVEANTWVTVSNEYTSFYLPTWVSEGEYTIQLRSISVSAEANNGEERTETLANIMLTNYTATDTIDVQVSGRIYGLTMYDITDYPTWQNVFRNKDSLTLTGNNYTVGIKNQNGLSTGRLSKYTFPLVNGSHPTYEDVGAIKLGYCTRFKFTTIGDLYNDDYVKILPKFYYVDAKGQNRQEVDLYYTETFNGKRNYMVKVGSDKDKLNTKPYMLGDEYWQVPNTEIVATSHVTGKTNKEVKSQKDTLFYFGDIRFSKAFRTFSDTSSYTPTGTIPSTIDPKLAMKSVQTWYGEYYLPSDTHVLPKDCDLDSYIKKYGAIDFKENIWLKNGYIIVNFDIVTYREGDEKGHLSYINKDNALRGYCNMWKMEGTQLVKTDSAGNMFDFKYGDYVMYYTEKSASKDYKSGGTH